MDRGSGMVVPILLVLLCAGCGDDESSPVSRRVHGVVDLERIVDRADAQVAAPRLVALVRHEWYYQDLWGHRRDVTARMKSRMNFIQGGEYQVWGDRELVLAVMEEGARRLAAFDQAQTLRMWDRPPLSPDDLFVQAARDLRVQLESTPRMDEPGMWVEVSLGGYRSEKSVRISHLRVLRVSREDGKSVLLEAEHSDALDLVQALRPWFDSQRVLFEADSVRVTPRYSYSNIPTLRSLEQQKPMRALATPAGLLVGVPSQNYIDPDESRSFMFMAAEIGVIDEGDWDVTYDVWTHRTLTDLEVWPGNREERRP